MNRKFCGSFFYLQRRVNHRQTWRRVQKNTTGQKQFPRFEIWRVKTFLNKYCWNYYCSFHFWLRQKMTTITTDTSPSIPFILFVSRENGTIIDPLCLRLLSSFKIKNKNWPELLGVKFWFFFPTFFSEKAKEAYGNLI